MQSLVPAASGIITADLSTLNLYEIAASTFANCANLESAILPDSMEMIGDYAFSGCGALESITLPDDTQKPAGERLKSRKYVGKKRKR